MQCLNIGKFIYKSENTEWNFPHFHFVVYKEDADDTIYAFCIELAIGDHGNDSKEAVRNLVYSCNSTIAEILNKNPDTLFKQLEFLATGDHATEFWQTYHLTEIRLAEVGQDVGNQTLDELRNDVNQLLRENENLRKSNFNLEITNLVQSALIQSIIKKVEAGV